ncbi:MAG: hypothetical protein R3F48_00825 [Candidatus Zixiibacteriota bacterium]
MRQLGILTAIFAGIFIHTFVFAAVPTIINYQGRLTDLSGAPVPDGVYTITFGIYASSGAPSPIWTSGAQDVTVSGGLFTYTLGSVVPLPHNIFDNALRYLGIQVESDAELTPRTMFTAVPYTYRALKADTATVANGLTDTAADGFVKSSGDTISGSLEFYGGGGYGGRIAVYDNAANLQLEDADGLKSILFGSSYGTLSLYDNSGDLTATLNAGYSAGGSLSLYAGDGAFKMRLNSNGVGNAAVQFPNDAIDSDEILDEPGISFANLYSSVDLVYDEVIDIRTIDITIPAAGYVYVMAEFTVALYGTLNSNGAWFQIDDEEGGSILGPQLNLITKPSSTSTSTSSHCGAVSYIYYYDTPGTYTFRLESEKVSNNGYATVSHARLAAMFFPTSYEEVKTVSSEPIDGADSQPVRVTNDDGTTQIMYESDLRQLELRAKQAKIEAQEAYIRQLEAERQLEDAQRSRQ